MQRQLRWNANPSLRGGLVDFEHHLPHLHVLQRRFLLPADDFTHAAAKFQLIECLAGLAHTNRHFGHFVAAAFTHCEEKSQQLFVQTGRETSDHAQIDQGDAMVIGEKNIARMPIGVKNGIDENLLEVGAKKLLGELDAIQFETRQRT